MLYMVTANQMIPLYHMVTYQDYCFNHKSALLKDAKEKEATAYRRCDSILADLLLFQVFARFYDKMFYRIFNVLRSLDIQYMQAQTEHVLFLIVADLRWVCTGWLLQRRQNGRDGVPKHQPHYCLLNRLFRRRLKKTSKLPVTGLCNSPVTGEFPSQRVHNAETVSIWWRHRLSSYRLQVEMEYIPEGMLTPEEVFRAWESKCIPLYSVLSTVSLHLFWFALHSYSVSSGN